MRASSSSEKGDGLNQGNQFKPYRKQSRANNSTKGKLQINPIPSVSKSAMLLINDNVKIPKQDSTGAIS
jgi:hypothetical protein